LEFVFKFVYFDPFYSFLIEWGASTSICARVCVCVQLYAEDGREEKKRVREEKREKKKEKNCSTTSVTI